MQAARPAFGRGAWIRPQPHSASSSWQQGRGGTYENAGASRLRGGAVVERSWSGAEGEVGAEFWGVGYSCLVCTNTRVSLAGRGERSGNAIGLVMQRCRHRDDLGGSDMREIQYRRVFCNLTRPRPQPGRAPAGVRPRLDWRVFWPADPTSQTAATIKYAGVSPAILARARLLCGWRGCRP